MNAQPIVEYDEIAMQLETVKGYSNFIPNVTTDEGYAKSKRVALDIGKLKTALEKTRKEKKAYWLEGGKLVDSKAKEIAVQLDEMQEPHQLAYKELDNAKKQREADRKAQLEQRLSEISTLCSLLVHSSSDEIQGAMESMAAETCEEFYEYTAEALKARNKAREELGQMYLKAVKAEKDAEELAALRAEQAKREQKEHDERIALEAAAKAEAKAQEAIRLAEKAKQDAIDAEANRAKEAQEAEQRRIFEVEQAELRARQQAEAAAKAERDRIEQERLEAEQAAKAREADIRHKKQINNEILTAILTTGITQEQAKAIICLAAKGKAGNMRVTY